MDTSLSPFMRLQEEFDSFYDREIEPKLAVLENRRRSHMRIVLVLLGLAALALCFLLTADTLSQKTGIAKNVVQLAAFGVMFGALLGAFFAYSGIYDRYKKILVGGVCSYLGLDYQLRRFAFPLERFTPILPFFKTSTLEDRITGSHAGVDFLLCEGRFSRNKHRSRAVLIQFAFPKPFRGETALAPDVGAAGNLLERMRQPGEPVRLEGMAFEERFEIYSSDPHEAHYLLTPVFMERILALASSVGGRNGLALAFVDSNLLVTLRLGEHRQRFESGHVFRPVTDGRKRALALFGELQLIIEIIDTLNLSRNKTA